MAIPLFLIFPLTSRPLRHALILGHRNRSIFATDYLAYSYSNVLKTIGGAQEVSPVVGALLICVGAQEPLWVPA